MTRQRSLWINAFLAAGLLAATPALAQRNGNEANGKDYQPTPGRVNGAEAATGVLPSPAEQSREAGTVDNVYKQLMGQQRPGAASGAAR